MTLGFKQDHPEDHPRLSDRVCATCAKPASGFGVIAQYKSRILWCCGDPDCFELAKETYEMDAREFTRLDGMAAVEGGAEAGEYLDEIGKFALDELTEQEWAEFCRRLVGGYRAALVGKLRDEAVF
ncbi:MAG: hypothetical protein ACOH2M_29645 [Cypionkella sp.]